MKKTIYLILCLIFISSSILYSEEGEEIIHSDNDEIINNSNRSNNDIKKNKDDNINNNKSEKSKQKKQIIKSETINSLDKLIDNEIDLITKKLKLQLTIKIRNEIKNEVKKINNKLFSNKNYEAEKIKKIIYVIVISKNKKIKKYNVKNKLLNSIHIQVGKDKRYGESINKNKSVPIVITVQNNIVSKGTLLVYAQDIKTKAIFLIHSINPFVLKSLWGQFQFNWTGNYIENQAKKILQPGRYKIFCIFKIRINKSKQLINYLRVWGHNINGYYVEIK